MKVKFPIFEFLLDAIESEKLTSKLLLTLMHDNILKKYIYKLLYQLI